MKHRPERIKKNIANGFGSLAYLFCFLQWFWAIVLYYSVILSAVSFIAQPADMQAEQSPDPVFTLSDPFGTILLAVVTLVMVAITIYFFIKIPVTIVKTSNKIVHETSKAAAPIIIKTQHKKDTKKARTTLTPKLVRAAKLLLVLVPIALTAASALLEAPSIDYAIAMIVGSGLACFSAMFFAVQYLFAGWFRVKMSDLW